MAIQKNFVVHNGLEVNQNLIIADSVANRVGIVTTSPKHTLHVNGGIGATDLKVSGISTFNNVVINNSVSVGSTTGNLGQYLTSTGTGVTWSSIPNTRTVNSQIAISGQDSFNISYTIGFIDVYINGIRLSESEYNANDGTTVILDTACFGGESVDFITYSSTNANTVSSYWSPTNSGIHTLSNVGIGTTNPTSKLTVNGSIIATDGFISSGSTVPLKIDIIGNQLVFSATGIGSTSLTLY